eukprot:g1573.t1
MDDNTIFLNPKEKLRKERKERLAKRKRRSNFRKGDDRPPPKRAAKMEDVQSTEKETNGDVHSMKVSEAKRKLAERVNAPAPERSSDSLLDVAVRMRRERQLNPEKIELERAAREEKRMIDAVTSVQVHSLSSAAERAKGVRYTESMKTAWRAPAHLESMSESKRNKLRKKWHIICEGENLPPPIKSFREMRFPQAMLDALKEKGIMRPTPIQVQGIPCALAGRDMIGIAFTGSGKTVVFSLPLVMLALEAEMTLPLKSGDGPIGMILCPSRELARQTYEVCDYFCKGLSSRGYPELRVMLSIGGESMKSQLDVVAKGVHIICATPGRLNAYLNDGRINLDLCRYVCLDEADRMLDMGFDEEIKNVFSHFTRQRQTLLFSATMPKKVQDFARESLVKPCVVNVCRAGAANLDVIQEVEYVKQEAKIVYLLECLQKTAPPVIIFCEKKSEVDDIHEYLLLKGVEAVSIHGNKSQEERNEAIQFYKTGKKDVLIATDIAAKGLDFPEIQHVINFDMPREIENYVHRIGRTGRSGKTGVATTFINRTVAESALKDLKGLLKEAKQRIPPVLAAIGDDEEDLKLQKESGVLGCSFCGGLGHRISNCPKREEQRRQLVSQYKDTLKGGDALG